MQVDFNDPIVAQAQQWEKQLKALAERFIPHFSRWEVRRHATAYVQALLGHAQRKNGWQLAESMGLPSPVAIHHLLGRAVWDVEAVRDDLRVYVAEHLGDQDAVLVVDETGFIKKGPYSVGVQRQYSGTAGRIENSQIGVFLAYASVKGHAFIDRELYLPRSWTEDAARVQRAGVPASRAFLTKPQLARNMLERAIEARVPFRWVCGDEVYGNDRRLRIWLEQRECSHVMAIATTQYLWCEEGRQRRAKSVAADLQPDDWQVLSAGEGAKGPRLYAWAYIPLLSWGASQQRGLLLRKSLSEPCEIAYYAVYAPHGISLATLARVAGRRWAIEEGFEASKQRVGLAHYEVRSWNGWYRHITLALFAHAFLTVLRSQALPKRRKKGGPTPSQNAAHGAGVSYL